MPDARVVGPPIESDALNRALHDGEGDPNQVLLDYLEAAEPHLRALILRNSGSLQPGDGMFLADLRDVLLYIRQSLEGRRSRYRLAFKRRPGNPGRSSDEEFRDLLAAIIVTLNTVDPDVKQEAEIAQMEKTLAVKRRDVFRHLARLRPGGRDRAVSQNPEN